MIQSKVHGCFAELIELGLITEQQRDAAQQYLESAQFQADITESGHLLARMVVQGIVPDNTLAELFSRRKSPMSGTGYERREGIIKATNDYVSRLKHAFNHEALTILRDELIITSDQFARAEAKLPTDVAFASPAAVLTWMMLSDLLSSEEIAVISADIEATRALSSSGKRVTIVDQTSAMLEEVQKETFRAAKKKYWNDLFPGPRWLWVIGFVAFFGYGAWGISKSKMVPTCDAPEVQQSIVASLLMAHVDAGRSSYIFPGGQHNSAVVPSLLDPRQVGYAKVENARGCLASLKFGDTEEPYAYTIKLASGEKHGYKIAEASPEIVQARYAHINGHGEFGNGAEPVGRAVLESAIRDGMKKFNESVSMISDDSIRQWKRASLGIHDPEKNHEIVDLEPDGNCRELAAGTRYSCEVLMERNGPFLSALSGNGLGIVKGDFTVERDRVGAPWHVSEEFATQYVTAIQRARMEILTDKVPRTNVTP